MIKIEDMIITPTIFPDKTSQIWKLNLDFDTSNTIKIEWIFESDNEIFYLKQLTDLLKNKNLKYELYVPYLPYARQDKHINNDSTFALHSFAEILNSMNFKTVTCLDVHSEIAATLINNLKVKSSIDNITELFNKLNIDKYCFPDNGAYKKYIEELIQTKLAKKDILFKELIDVFIKDNLATSICFADKIRNQETGKIESMVLNGEVENKKILIVDDICDGGGTFIWLTDLLLKAKASEVYLFVTHGIFSNNALEKLKLAGIKQVFTHDNLDGFFTN